MPDFLKHGENIAKDGFTIIENIFSHTEVKSLINTINQINSSNPTFRKSKDLFAIRQFLKEIPEISPLIFTANFNNTISNIFGYDNFVVKSIYFDKPEQSNWFVAWHQDLTISVDRKIILPGFSSWTSKHNQFAVQPPIHILENSFTIRIHLDDTDENNGALKVIPGSHTNGVRRIEELDISNEYICKINSGDVMIMRPLLFHASNRTINNKRRRVIHIEFSNAKLPHEIKWSEAN